MPQFTHLFDAIKVGNVELKNRMVMLAIGTGYSEPDGTVGDRFINFYVERAKGGVGLIIAPFAPFDMGLPFIPGLYDDRFIPGARRLADAVHAYGTKIAPQFLGQYFWVNKENGSFEFIAPSPVFNRMVGATPKALTVEEIHLLVDEYGEAGWRTREAGFDAIELHLGIGYLLNRFISPCTNNRTDEYGGILENRMRFPLEIIARIHKRAGEDYPIICRVSADEFMRGGHTLEDSKRVSTILEAAGVQAMDVEAGWHECPEPLVVMSVPRGAFVYLAEEIKKVVNVPVVAAYRINNPELAEQILADGKADLIGLGRALLADPEFSNKAREGRTDEIRTCIACSNCLDNLLTGYKSGTVSPAFCSLNPTMGKEAEYAIEPARVVKRVLVVGGGPGGMEAARVAALRGHQVTLCEKGEELGGQLRVACLPRYKDELGCLIESMATQVRKAGVEVRLNTEVTPGAVEKEDPDVVIVATGATPAILDVPGVKQDNVVTAVDVLTRRKDVGETAIVIGGGMVGCETAEFLAALGKEVTIVEMLPKIGSDYGATYRHVVLRRLRKTGIKMETNVMVEEITDRGVKAKRDGIPRFFPGDTVVLAVGFKPNKELGEKLSGKVPALYSIGDCVEPRRIREAIEEGFRLAREI
ncbi:Metal reductase [subsurface metagenome]